MLLDVKVVLNVRTATAVYNFMYMHLQAAADKAKQAGLVPEV